jgi:hypothetical protein
MKPLEEYIILEVMYQKMEEDVRTWKPESKGQRSVSCTEENIAGTLYK